MTHLSKILTGATILVMGTASLAAAFPGGERGERGGAPMFLQMFDQLDADGDGKLTEEELASKGPAAAFAEADADGDGLLSSDELAAFADAREAARKAQRQERMLSRLDTNEDGQLSLEELEAHGPDRGRMFEAMDKDGDGVVTKTELSQMRPMMGKRGGERGERGEHDGHGEHGKKMRQ